MCECEKVFLTNFLVLSLLHVYAIQFQWKIAAIELWQPAEGAIARVRTNAIDGRRCCDGRVERWENLWNMWFIFHRQHDKKNHHNNFHLVLHHIGVCRIKLLCAVIRWGGWLAEEKWWNLMTFSLPSVCDEIFATCTHDRYTQRGAEEERKISSINYCVAHVRPTRFGLIFSF